MDQSQLFTNERMITQADNKPHIVSGTIQIVVEDSIYC